MDTRKRRCVRSATAPAETEAESRAAAGASSTESDQPFTKTKGLCAGDKMTSLSVSFISLCNKYEWKSFIY